MDFEKAFNSIHRESLWRILREYGIPQQIFLVIKSFYNNFKCRVGKSESSFGVKTVLARNVLCRRCSSTSRIDRVMQQTTSDQPWGIRWTLFSTLKGLDFDLALVSFTHQHMQEKTTFPSLFAQHVGLKISQTKTEVMLNEQRKSSNVRRIHLPR